MERGWRAAATALGARMGLPHLSKVGWSPVSVAGLVTLVAGIVPLVTGAVTTIRSAPLVAAAGTARARHRGTPGP
jgi:hypothetical protein